MSNQPPPAQPEPPAELWMVYSHRLRCWLRDLDMPPGVVIHHAVASEEAAKKLAALQDGFYDLQCEPVRVK